MVNIISLITLLISFLGLIFILLRKIPILIQFSSEEITSSDILDKVKFKIKTNGFAKMFSSKEVFLHKILSKFRILTLKTENKTGNLLDKLRQKHIEKKAKKDFSSNYWNDIQKKK
ncbi:MAG: hypothetical protein ABH956_03160 [Candidatus Nealsonbacteria bacterium]